MKFEKLTVFSSLALMTGFIVREIMKSKIRIHTMAIRRDQLQAYQDDETVETIYFNPFYDNVFLKKDRVELVGHVQTSDDTADSMDGVPLEKTGITTFFNNQRDYSAYKLEKANGDLQTILDHFSNPAKVIYILFKPVPYPEDNDYLAYELIGADATKHPIAKLAAMMVVQPPMAYATTAAGGGSAHEAAAAPLAFAMSNTSSSLRMNPSPPATRGISAF